MKLSDLLKQFKHIEPDPQFSERSKREVLLSPRPEQGTMRGVFAFLHILETGAAVVLAGFFILILTGSFSPARSVAPIQYSVVDPEGLHAEAQAIDMQIQLANLAYPQTTSTASAGGSNVIAPAALKNAFEVVLGAPSTSSTPTTGTASATTSTATTTTLSIDAALQRLSH